MFSFADLTGIGKALKGFASELRANRVEQERLRQRKEEIRYAPATKADVIAAVCEWADNARGTFVSEALPSLLTRLRLPAVVGNGQLVREAFFSVGLMPGGPGGQVHRTDVDRFMAALFGELFRDAVVKMIEAQAWPEHVGLPMAERDAAIARIDVQLEKLIAQEAKLVSAAQAAGIAVD